MTPLDDLPEHLREVHRPPLSKPPPFPFLLALKAGGVSVGATVLIILLRVVVSWLNESEEPVVAEPAEPSAVEPSPPAPTERPGSLSFLPSSFLGDFEATATSGPPDQLHQILRVTPSSLWRGVDTEHLRQSTQLTEIRCSSDTQCAARSPDGDEYSLTLSANGLAVCTTPGDAEDADGTPDCDLQVPAGSAPFSGSWSHLAEVVAGSSPGNHAPRSYPVACHEDDVPDGLVLVSGTEDLCVATKEAAIVASTPELPNPPVEYDDNDPVSLFIGPHAALEEVSDLTSRERRSIVARVRATRYHSWGFGACTPRWTATVGRLSVECEFDEYYVSDPPRVVREQECETMPGDSCGECDSNSDCHGLFCGCPRSRCVFGQCTSCPSERMCEEPTYEVHLSPWTVRATFASDAERELAQSAAEDGGWRLLVGARITRAFRDVRTRRPTSAEIFDEEYERGETVIENDTGYYLGLEPYYVGYVRCARTCDPAQGVDVVDLLTRRGTTYRLTAGDDRRVTVTCTHGTCTGRLSSGER